VTIKFLLNFTLPIFMLRISSRGPLDCHLLILHQPLLVNESLLINSTLDWVIQPCGSFIMFFNLISSLLRQINLLRCIPHVSSTNFINYIFLSVIDPCPLVLWIFFLWMYRALLLYFPIIINVISFILWMIFLVTHRFSSYMQVRCSYCVY
jgi:hypothetical protein